jgi:hydrogenase maturation factor
MPRKKIDKTPKLNEEELRKQKLEYDLEEIRKERFISEPTYKFNIGDKVIIGNLKDVYVEKILDDSKIYLIDFTRIDENYGNPIKYEHQKMYVTWTDIRKYQENLSKDLIRNSDLRMSFMQQTISSLFNKVYHFGVDFEPEYQRDFVWNLEDKIALIDSIFNNVEIGKFVFIHLGYYGKYAYEILDGKQRLKTLLDFFEDRFQYKGKYFSDLSIREQDFFEDYSVSVAETRDELTREQKLRYFLKLNTNGKVMAKEQLEKVEKMLEQEEKNNDSRL